MGKTELIYRFTEMTDGVLVLGATCSPGERDFELGVLGQLIHSATLPAEFARRATDLLDGGEQADQETSVRLSHEICALLLDLANEYPLVITVDDVQFTDAASLRVLLYLQRRIRSARVLLVLAESPQARPAHLMLRDEVLRQPQSRLLRLAPLSQDGVRALLARHVGESTAHQLAEPWYALSGGSPLLLHALADDYLAAGREGNETVAGDSFGHAVLTCLRRDERLLPVARAVSVLAESTSMPLVGALLGVDARTVQQATSVMNEAGLIDDGRFRHPAAREAVVRDIDHVELADLRLRVARLLHEDGVAAANVAEHLIAAGRTPEHWAVGVLRDAAVEALVRNDIGHAVDCLELARLACEDELERIAVTSLLATAQWLIDPAAAARHVTRLHAAFEQGLLTERETWALLRTLVWQGRATEAGSMLDQLDRSTADRDAATEAERQVTREWLFFTQPRLLLDHAEPGTEPDADWVSLGPLASVTVFGATPDAIEGAERVLQRSRIGETPLEELVVALQTLIYGEREDRATRWCDELLEDAATHPAVTWRAVLSDIAAGIALRRGDLVAAERLARAALGALPAQSWGVALGSPLAHLMQACTRLGKIDEAERCLSIGVPQAMQKTRFWLQYALARGQYYLATDRLRGALSDFLAVGELAREWRLDLPVLVPWRHEAAQVYVRLGKIDRARELIGEQLTMPGGTGARIRGLSLRALASASDPAQRPAMLRESVDLLRVPGDWYELALAFADLSCAYETLEEFDQARVAARRALRLAKSCQARTLQEHLQHSQTATGGLDFGEARNAGESMAPLSAAERRVATLAALGHTNREISRRLSITVSTVEQHLTRTYRKLKINRRSDLPILSMPNPRGSFATEPGTALSSEFLI